MYTAVQLNVRAAPVARRNAQAMPRSPPACGVRGRRGRAELWLLIAGALRRVAAPHCMDGDTGCEQRDCSMWCNRWTCKKEGCHGCGKLEGCDDKPPPPPRPPPIPALPPWDTGVSVNTLTIDAHQGALYANGRRLHIKGVNWFGSEGRSGPPLGLDKHNSALAQGTSYHSSPIHH